LGFLPKARALLGGCGYDADRLRKALIEREIIPCIPGRKARKLPVEDDAERDQERRRIENMFGRRKDWRRIATRYDRCADLFLSACCLAAVVLYWL
jgi:transposase